MTDLPNSPPLCPYCGQPSRLDGRVTQVRRGDRVLSVSVKHWLCDLGCVEEDGTTPFRFEDPALMRGNDEAIRAAWLARFGEQLPRAGRPGRKPKEARQVRVQVMLTASELAQIDKERGSSTRSEYMRRRVLQTG